MAWLRQIMFSLGPQSDKPLELFKVGLKADATDKI